MTKQLIDKALNKFISRKLMVWIACAALTYLGSVDSADFVIISAIYIGSQSVIDGIVKVKSA